MEKFNTTVSFIYTLIEILRLYSFYKVVTKAFTINYMYK